MSAAELVKWDPTIRSTKQLLVFATPKVVASIWNSVLTSSIAEFNRISINQSLGVQFVRTTQPPEPDVKGAADVQFDLGNGIMSYRVYRRDITVMDREKNPPQPAMMDPFGMHGVTSPVNSEGFRIKAMIFVPESPQIDVGAGKRRLAGQNVMKFMAMHELIHATGPKDGDHNLPGPGADVFATLITAISGNTPADDKIELDGSGSTIRFAPPFEIKQKVGDLIRRNWS